MQCLQWPTPSVHCCNTSRRFGQEGFAGIYDSEKMTIRICPHENSHVTCNHLGSFDAIRIGGQSDAWCDGGYENEKRFQTERAVAYPRIVNFSNSEPIIE